MTIDKYNMWLLLATKLGQLQSNCNQHISSYVMIYTDVVIVMPLS